MVVKELWGELEFKNSLATAARAWWDRRRLVLFVHPKRRLYGILLLRVTKDLFGVVSCNDIEKFEISAHIVILCVFIDEFFKCTTFCCTFFGFLLNIIFTFIVRSSINFCVLLVIGVEQILSLLVSNLESS